MGKVKEMLALLMVNMILTSALPSPDAKANPQDLFIMVQQIIGKGSAAQKESPEPMEYPMTEAPAAPKAPTTEDPAAPKAPTTAAPATETPTTQAACNTEDMTQINDEWFMIGDGTYYSFEDAKQYCTSMDLVMAEPRNPRVVSGYLFDTYGMSDAFWYGAEADDENVFHWTSTGEAIIAPADYWPEFMGPGGYCNEQMYDADCCLSSMDEDTPYVASSCNAPFARALCQCSQS